MEHRTDLIYSSRDQKYVASGKRTVPSHSRQGAKLRDMLMSDNHNLSHTDFHHEITRSQDGAVPKHVRSQQCQVLQKLTPKEDELVRYMSNLPSFLEKGKNVQEKALNVGVLDWKRLEKWQHSQKQMPHKHKGCSPSSSNTSLFSTDGSSTHSSRGPSCSPAEQRMHHLSLQSPLEASPNEAKSSSGRVHSCSSVCQKTQNHVLRSHRQKEYDGGEKCQDIGVFRRNAGKFQDSSSKSAYNLSGQQKVLGPLHQCERSAYDLKSLSDMDQQPSFDKFEVAGKPNTERNQSTKQPLRSQKTKLNAADQYCSGREESGVVITPRDQSETSCSGVTTSSDFAGNSRLSVEPGPKNISGRSSFGDLLPSKVDSCGCSTGFSSEDLEGVISSSEASKTPLQITDDFHDTSRISTQTVKGPSQASHMFSFPARMLGSASRSRKTEEKKPVAGLRHVTAAKPSDELDVRKSSDSILKGRNPSPIRRLSFAMGQVIKNAGSRDNSPVRRSSSKDCTATTAKSGSEGPTASVPIDNPCSDKSFANNNRGRSSPLRRLLDPFLKSTDSNKGEPSKKHSSPAVGTRKSCSDRVDFCKSVKVKSRSAGGSMTTVTDLHHNSKSEMSSLQALLQVSFKNGFPLFTFGIDNESDILAATVRNSFVPAKGHRSWTYTFFTVREMKRKSGIWLNKSDGPGFVPNVVAQMKVADFQDSPLSNYETADFQITREFDLFAVDGGDEDGHPTDFHPTNELAAIVVKLPKISCENHRLDSLLSYNWLSSRSCFTKSMQETRSCADFDDDSQNPHFPRCSNFSTTVILPGGVHTVPSKGEISTLLHRWMSGGLCDCGGWDLGCQLLIYTNKREYERETGSVACPSENMFQLFSQMGQDNQPILSLAPFKESIYSVEFDSSLTLLQAFAICISFLDRKRPAEIAEKITNEVGVFEVPSIMKTRNHQVDVPARYASYPPDSPVGRV